MRRFASFAEFYPYYLEQHRSRANRRLHLAGQAAAVLLLLAAALTGVWWLLPADLRPIFKAVLVLGTYGVAYLGLAKLARLEEVESLLAGVRRRLGR